MSERPSAGFRAAVALTALGLVALALVVARQEWFYRDDFVFLERAMREPFGWSEAFLPLQERFWIFYRPLAMETFFYAGYRLFGLDAFPFFVASLAAHFASGPLAWRLALRLGYEPRVALATGLLAVSRPPLVEIYWGSCFMYAGVELLTLVALLAFLRQLEGGGRGSRLLSCLALLLAFGCNEIAVAIPGVLALTALCRGDLPATPSGLARLARALAPQLVLSALYLGFRFGLVGPIDSVFWNELVATSVYRHQLGPHVVENAAFLLGRVYGSAPAGAAALASVALCAFALARRRDAPLAWLARMQLLAAGWLLGLLPAFALLPQQQPRWALLLALPVCLAVTAWWSAAARGLTARGRGRFEIALALALVASLPVAELVRRAQSPAGGPARELAGWLAANADSLPERASFVVLYGGPEQGSAAEALHLRQATFTGTLFRVVAPEHDFTLRFQDVSERTRRNVLRGDALFFELQPGAHVTLADETRLARELPRAPPVLH